MQPFRRGAALMASLSVLALAGCHHGDTDDTGHPALNASSAEATVNGVDITQQQFFTQLQGYIPNTQVQPVAAGQVVLQQMIDGLLMEQLAKEQGVAPTDAQVNSLYSTLQVSQEAQSVKPFAQLLSESGLTEQDVKEFKLRTELAQINLLTKGMASVTDAEVSAFYAKNKAQYTKPNRAHIKRIVLTNEADAKRIYDQIQKGQSFDSFVSQSLDRQFPGGDVPVWVPLDPPATPQQAQQLSQIMLPGLVQSINKADPGTPAKSVTPPFSFHGVYWLLQVVEKKPKEVVPLDQVKDSIRIALMAQRARQDPARFQAIQQQLRDFQAKAKIVIPDKRYTQLLAQLTTPPPPTAAPSFAPPGLPASPGAGIKPKG